MLHVVNGGYTLAEKIKLIGVNRRFLPLNKLTTSHQDYYGKTVPGEIQQVIDAVMPGIEDVMAKHHCTLDQATEVIPFLIRAKWAHACWIIQHADVAALTDCWDDIEHNWPAIEHDRKFYEISNIASITIDDTDVRKSFFTEFIAEYFPSFPENPNMANVANFQAAAIIQGRDF